MNKILSLCVPFLALMFSVAVHAYSKTAAADWAVSCAYGCTGMLIIDILKFS